RRRIRRLLPTLAENGFVKFFGEPTSAFAVGCRFGRTEGQTAAFPVGDQLPDDTLTTAALQDLIEKQPKRNPGCIDAVTELNATLLDRPLEHLLVQALAEDKIPRF